MTDLWSKILLAASLDGVEFPVAERSMATGRRLARYPFPYRNGQGVEDTGRKIFTWKLVVPLWAGVDPKHYPGTFDDLLAIVEDENKKAEVEYVDPELGPFKVKVVDYTWQTVPEKRNGGILSIDLEERGFDQSILQNLNNPKLAARSRAKKAALAVDRKMLDMGEDFQGITRKPQFSLTEMWNDFQGALDTAALAADDYAAQIDEVTFVATKIMSFNPKEEIERWSIVQSCVDFIGAAQDVGESTSGSPADDGMIEVTLPDTMSMYEIATWRYGDSFRAEEISFNNPTPNVLAYARGSKVKVFRT